MFFESYTFVLDVNRLGAKQAARQFVHDALRMSPLSADVMYHLRSTSLYWFYFRPGGEHETVYFDDVATDDEWFTLKARRKLERFRALVRLAKRHCLPRDIVKRIFALL